MRAVRNHCFVMEKCRRIERFCYSIGSYEETYLKMLILLTIDTSRSDVNIKHKQKSTFNRKWTLNFGEKMNPTIWHVLKLQASVINELL